MAAAPWAVLVSWPCYERRVERALQRRGFRCYLPRTKTLSAKPRTVLLFPRYVFAGPADAWAALRDIPGVGRLLRRGFEHGVVSDEEVEALRAREQGRGFVKLAQVDEAVLQVGQKVRVKIGHFVGREGVYQGRSRRKEYVRMGPSNVVLPIGCLEAS